MDVLVEHGKAHNLYPDGAPELHPSILIIKNYTGQVEEGWDWSGSVFTPPPTPIVTAEQVRAQRDALLAETDWAMLTDVTAPAGYLEYRQALRDVPAQAGFPADVTWPTKP